MSQGRNNLRKDLLVGLLADVSTGAVLMDYTGL